MLNPYKKAIILNGTTYDGEGINYKGSSTTYEISDNRFRIDNTTGSTSLSPTNVSHNGQGVEDSSTYYYSSSLGNDIKFGKYTSESGHVWPEQYWAQYSVNGASVGDYGNYSTATLTSTNLSLIKNDTNATTEVDRNLSAIISVNGTTLSGKKANPASSYENNYSSVTYSPFGIDLYSPDSYPYHHHIDSKGSSMACYYVKYYHNLYGSTYIDPGKSSTAIYASDGGSIIKNTNNNYSTFESDAYGTTNSYLQYTHTDNNIGSTYSSDYQSTVSINYQDINRYHGASTVGWNNSTVNSLNNYLGLLVKTDTFNSATNSLYQKGFYYFGSAGSGGSTFSFPYKTNGQWIIVTSHGSTPVLNTINIANVFHSSGLVFKIGSASGGSGNAPTISLSSPGTTAVKLLVKSTGGTVGVSGIPLG